MQEHDLNAIHPGMEVCDVDGHDVGTVAQIHRLALASAGPGAAVDRPTSDVIEIKSGLFGLGKHYFVPGSAVEETTRTTVVLGKPRAEFEQLGWTRKPSGLGG